MSMTTQDLARSRELATGRYAEAVGETEAFDLPVQGAIPRELSGRFVRNGPNARPGMERHPFMEDGMLHAVRVQDGHVRWYRNRWVRTRSFESGAKYRRLDGSFDLTASVANTNAVAHGGRMLALVESSYPYEVTPDLDTVGPWDFAGKLRTPFTAHPKRCPRTGELHAFGMHYSEGLTYLRVERNGELTVSRHIDVPRVTMMHDFALTRDHVLFLDLPVVFNVLRALRGDMPFAWSDRYRPRIGVLRRDDPHGDVRWFDIAPCYVFHVLNAHEDGDALVLDAVRYREIWRTGTSVFPPASLHRWTIDLASGAVRETPLDDGAVEFPRHDERRLGEAYRYGYTVDSTDGARARVRKYDLVAGTSVVRDFGPHAFVAETVFAPREGATGEDDGWLMAFVYDADRDASDFVVLDAATLETAATVALPQRVPFGFHGNWIDDADIA